MTELHRESLLDVTPLQCCLCRSGSYTKQDSGRPNNRSHRQKASIKVQQISGTRFARFIAVPATAELILMRDELAAELVQLREALGDGAYYRVFGDTWKQFAVNVPSANASGETLPPEFWEEFL